MKNLNIREKTLLIILGVMLISYLYYISLLSPLLVRIANAKAQINKYEVELKNIDKIISLSDKRKNQIDELSAKIEDVYKALPQKERNPQIAYILDTFADACNVSINSLSFGERQDYAADQKDGDSQSEDAKMQNVKGTEKDDNVGLLVVPVTITITGEYNSITDFIEKVENDKRIAKVEQVNMLKNEGILQSSINIDYFYIDTDKAEDGGYDFNSGTYGKSDLFK